MSEELSWEQKGDRARRGLKPLHFLLGDWSGEGVDQGLPIFSETSGRLLLDESWLELRELLTDERGVRIYQDISLYRFDPVEDGLRVLHLMPHGHYKLYPVVRRANAFRWATGPYGPKVDLAALDDGWQNLVTLPEESEPGLRIRYRRRVG